MLKLRCDNQEPIRAENNNLKIDGERMMRYDATMLNVGYEKQLFVDDLIIESVENVCRTWRQPVKSPDNPIIGKDQPWENMVYFNCNDWHVERDPKDGLFKCWYTDWFLPEVTAKDGAIGNSVIHLLYAESEDGIRWRKPTFDIFKYNGSNTNVVIPNGHVLGMVIDPHEQDESKRYKMMTTIHVPGGDVGGVVAVASADGIHWTPYPERPVMGRSGSRLDDVIVMNYDPWGRLFVMNTRNYDMYAVARNLKNPVLEQWVPPYYPLDWSRMNKRRVWQAESSDFIHWTDPYLVLAAEDGLDDLDETFYGLCQFPIGTVTIGFQNIYNYVPNTMRVRLVYSRDGKNWHHLNKRQPFIAPDPESPWDSCINTITSRPIPVGDELYVYFGGSRSHHDWYITGKREGLSVPEAHDRSLVGWNLGLARMRLDGFASLDAGPARRGIFITRPLISEGTRLVVNARCLSGGSIAAEVVNLRDEVFPGYSRTECDLFNGDSCRHVVSWKGKTTLPPAARERANYPKAEFERFRKIRFYMENAELYSLTLAP